MSFENITAFCADTLHHKLAAQACRFMAAAGFSEIVLVTNEDFLREVEISSLPGNLRIELIPTISGKAGYSSYIINHMVDHIRTDYILVFQWDGFVINKDQWWPGYMEYDYIGAPWPSSFNFTDQRNVGNGGFSLRSRKLMAASREIGYPADETAEDLVICREQADELEKNWRIKFAPASVAKFFSAESLNLEKYSHEEEKPAEKTFGFHGFFNFHLAFDDTNLFNVIDNLITEKERIKSLTSWEATVLLNNLWRDGRSEAVIKLTQRMARACGLNEEDVSPQTVIDIILARRGASNK